MTTLTTFLSFIRSIEVSGVSKLDSVPNTVKPGDLPVSFPMFPRSAYAPRYADDSDLTSFTGDLLILFARAEQGTPAEDYATLARLVDATHTAINTAATLLAGFSSISWTLAPQNYQVGTSGDYHVIVATITAEV